MSSTAPAPAVILEAVAAVVLSALLPVVSINIITVVATVVSAAAAAAPSSMMWLFTPAVFTLIESFMPFVIWLNLSRLDQLVLLLHVVDLRHNLEIVLLPLGGRVEGEEGLGGLLVREFNIDRALEEVALNISAETDTVDGPKGTKESLEVELSRRLLVAESLDVDSRGYLACPGIVLRDIGVLALDDLLALLALDIKKSALSQCSDDGIAFKDLHAFELADRVGRNRVVLAATCQVPQELVRREVGIAKVEFNLDRVSGN